MVDGYLEKSVAGSSNVTLTASNSVADESRQRVLKFTGTLTGNIDVIVPAEEKNYVVWNATSGSFTLTFKPSGGTGLVVPQDYAARVFTDGSTMYQAGAWVNPDTGSSLRLHNTITTLYSADASATSGPELELHRDSPSPAASDHIGLISFKGEDTAGAKQSYARIFGRIEDTSDTSGDGALLVEVLSSGAFSTKMVVSTNQTLIDGINDSTTGSAANVFIDSGTGLLSRSTSSRRYKTAIRPYERGLADLLKLAPIRYRGKSKQDEGKEFAGLAAEDVHDAGLTEFVLYDNEGSPDALNYPQMVALLVNAVKELTTRVELLERRQQGQP